MIHIRYQESGLTLCTAKGKRIHEYLEKDYPRWSFEENCLLCEKELEALASNVEDDQATGNAFLGLIVGISLSAVLWLVLFIIFRIIF